MADAATDETDTAPLVLRDEGRSAVYACSGCGVEVRRARSAVVGRVWCSRECQRRHAPPTKPRRGVTRPCPACGSDVYSKPGSSRIYCSVACRGQAKQVVRVKRACAACGTSFDTRPAEDRRFCSTACAGNGSTGQQTVACQSCGEEFTARGSEATARRFCSRACFYAAQSANASGWINASGYRFVSVAGRKVAEHRAVTEGLLGRPLATDESVHHRNGVRHDNRAENLELWIRAQPAGQRVEDVVAHAEAMLARYAPASLARARR